MAKAWTPEEVDELVALAKRKGFNSSQLADAIGVDRATVSRWKRKPRPSEIPLLTRNALSWIELRLNSLDDRTARDLQ